MDSAPGTPSAPTTPPAFAATASPGFMEMGSTVSQKVRGEPLAGLGAALCIFCCSLICDCHCELYIWTLHFHCMNQSPGNSQVLDKSLRNEPIWLLSRLED